MITRSLSLDYQLRPFNSTQHMQSSRSVTNPEELQELRTQGLEAAAFLKSAILQAEANESGNFGTSQLKKIASIRSTSKQYSTPVLPPYDAEMNVSADQVNTYMEPIVTGMSLPREKKSRGKKE